MSTRSFTRIIDNKFSEWSYNAEGGYQKCGEFTTGSKKETLNSITLQLGSGTGYFHSPTELTGSGGRITNVSLKINGSTSTNFVTVTNTIAATSGGWPDTSSNWSTSYTFNFNNVTLSANTTYSVQINTPTTSAGSSGLVLCLNNRRGDSISYTQYQDTFTVSYNANGGSNPPSSQTGTIPITLSSSKPSRTNCQFDSWNTKSDGSGDSYNPGGRYNKSADVTLYAIWKYKLTLSSEDNLGVVVYTGNNTSEYTSIGNSIYTYVKSGSNFDSSKILCTWDEDSGKTLNSWNTNSDGSGVNYDKSSSIPINGVTTLYGMYSSLAEYTVSFYDGKYPENSLIKTIKKKFGQSVSKSEYPPAPDWQGHQFSGWLGDGTYIRGNVDITAMWGRSPVWVMTEQGWKNYTPKEV